MKKVTYLTESAKKFSREEAIAEAKRCLLCEEAYCNKMSNKQQSKRIR